MPIKKQEGIVRRPEEFATRKEYERYLDETLGPSDDVFGSPMKDDLLKEWDKVNAKNVTPKEKFIPIRKDQIDDIESAIKADEGIMATDEAAEIVKKRTDDIATGDVTGETSDLMTDLEGKMTGIKKAADELKKISAPENIMEQILKGQRARDPRQGVVRAAAREILNKNKVKIGREDPIDVLRKMYGEKGLEALDAVSESLLDAQSYGEINTILTQNKLFDLVPKKTYGYDQSIVTAEKLRKAKEQEAKNLEILKKFKPDREPSAHGGIAGNLHLNRTGFSKGSEFIGPTWESPKKSLDDIIGSIFGKREDRPDSGILLGAGAGPMGRPAGRRDDISSSIIQDTTANLAKAMLYGIKNYEKEDQQTLYSFMDNGIKLKINNQATGIETDAAEKFNLNVPTRIDDNTLFSVALDTYNKLPVDLQAKIKASTNLAKDESWSALVKGNNLGITYNSDNQKIEGYYDVKLDSETLKPTTIRPKFEKDNRIM